MAASCLLTYGKSSSILVEYSNLAHIVALSRTLHMATY